MTKSNTKLSRGLILTIFQLPRHLILKMQNYWIPKNFTKSPRPFWKKSSFINETLFHTIDGKGIKESRANFFFKTLYSERWLLMAYHCSVLRHLVYQHTVMTNFESCTDLNMEDSISMTMAPSHFLAEPMLKFKGSSSICANLLKNDIWKYKYFLYYFKNI